MIPKFAIHAFKKPVRWDIGRWPPIYWKLAVSNTDGEGWHLHKLWVRQRPAEYEIKIYCIPQLLREARLPCAV
jgi:hypothetical protein